MVNLTNNLPAGWPGTANAKLPAVYEQAKQALAACESLDECKSWSDKMAALVSYAKQAGDETLLNTAKRIRARASRRAGDLLKEINGQGQRTDQLTEGAPGKLTQREAAAQAGMSEHQQLQAVRIAHVPEDEFEKLIEREKPSTLTELADRGRVTTLCGLPVDVDDDEVEDEPTPETSDDGDYEDIPEDEFDTFYHCRVHIEYMLSDVDDVFNSLDIYKRVLALESRFENDDEMLTKHKEFKEALFSQADTLLGDLPGALKKIAIIRDFLASLRTD